jgi:hypothetical protein
LSLLNLQRDKNAKTARIGPGKHHTCLSVPLSEIFSDAPPQAGVRNDRKWEWSWSARPGPPPTPIHNHDGSLASEVALWGSITIDNRTFQTEPVLVKIKSALEN